MRTVRAIAILFALFGATPLLNAADPEYAHPEQVAALSALLSSATSPATEPAPEPSELIQLSRLLSEPCDQLRWLLAQAQAFGAQPEQEPAARSLAQAAATRGQELAELGLLDHCREIVPALRDVSARLESIEDLTDPAALRQRLEQAESLRGLSSYAKFVLLARGAPAAKLLADGPRAVWDTPRAVLDRLADTAELPAFAELCNLRQQLIASYERLARQQPPAFPNTAQQRSVAASFQVAAALLDRALGLDVGDQPTSGPPISYPRSQEEWAAAAAPLESDVLRTWAALARLLEACPSANQAVQPAAEAAARSIWSDVRNLNPELWAAVDDTRNGWLMRLERADRLFAIHGLPLASGWGAERIAARRHYEDEVRNLLGSGPPTDEALADRVLQAIEHTKAVEFGLDADFKPLNMNSLKTLLGGNAGNWVYLFVEMLELHDAAPGAPATFCGVAVYRPEYAKYVPGRQYSDQCVAKIVRSAGSPEDVLRAALAAPGPPLVGNAQVRKDARIIIAPDGALPPSWFAFERQTLLRATEWTADDPAWVVYAPSAAAISSNRWTLDATLRAWYRAAVRDGQPTPAFDTGLSPLATGNNPGPPLKSRLLGTMEVVRVALGQTPARPDEELSDFLAAKRGAEIPAIALCLAGGASGPAR